MRERSAFTDDTATFGPCIHGFVRSLFEGDLRKGKAEGVSDCRSCSSRPTLMAKAEFTGGETGCKMGR